MICEVCGQEVESPPVFCYPLGVHQVEAPRRTLDEDIEALRAIDSPWKSRPDPCGDIMKLREEGW